MNRGESPFLDLILNEILVVCQVTSDIGQGRRAVNAGQTRQRQNRWRKMAKDCTLKMRQNKDDISAYPPGDLKGHGCLQCVREGKLQAGEQDPYGWGSVTVSYF